MTTIGRQRYVGYLYAFFKRESADGEQIYFALSEANDALRFDDLNGGKPVLYSTLGECGVRYPHIVRSPEGDRFYLLATDLRLYVSRDWDRHQRRGSRSIMVWESTDLVNWGEGRLVEVAPPEAGNTWAPEAVWDPEQEATSSTGRRRCTTTPNTRVRATTGSCVRPPATSASSPSRACGSTEDGRRSTPG